MNVVQKSQFFAQCQTYFELHQQLMRQLQVLSTEVRDKEEITHYQERKPEKSTGRRRGPKRKNEVYTRTLPKRPKGRPKKYEYGESEASTSTCPMDSINQEPIPFVPNVEDSFRTPMLHTIDPYLNQDPINMTTSFIPESHFTVLVFEQETQNQTLSLVDSSDTDFFQTPVDMPFCTTTQTSEMLSIYNQYLPAEEFNTYLGDSILEQEEPDLSTSQNASPVNFTVTSTVTDVNEEIYPSEPNFESEEANGNQQDANDKTEESNEPSSEQTDVVVEAMEWSPVSLIINITDSESGGD